MKWLNRPARCTYQSVIPVGGLVGGLIGRWLVVQQSELIDVRAAVTTIGGVIGMGGAMLLLWLAKSNSSDTVVAHDLEQTRLSHEREAPYVKEPVRQKDE
jgi:hypothetical protein